jgi:hypothetical protein
MPAQQLEAPASSAVVKDTGHGPTAKLAGATVADAAPGKPLIQSTPQKQHDASTDKPKAEAQKASRGRRSKPKPKEADAPVPAETKPAEAKPARKAPARRSSKAAVDVTVTAEKDGASVNNDKPAAGSKETTPKPKRRRVAKKLPSAKDPAAGD